MPHISRLTDISRPAVEAAAETLAKAFNTRDDYVWGAIVRGRPAHEVERLGLAVNKIRVHEGVRDLEVYVARADDSPKEECRPGAVLIFRPPSPTAPPPPCETPYSAEYKSLAPKEVQESERTALEDEGLGEDEWKNYHLVFLGTAPWAQRKGLGSALLRSVVERAHADGKRASLSTQSTENVEYYSRFGFKVKAKRTFEINGTPVNFWTMATDYPTNRR